MPRAEACRRRPGDALGSGLLLLDGAQGTELERRGVRLGASKLWSAQLLLDDPALVRAIHLDYLRAGSDIITTFTYQASMEGFAEAGIDAPRAAALLNLAVDLADAARQDFLAEQEQQLQQQQPQQQQQQPNPQGHPHEQLPAQLHEQQQQSPGGGVAVRQHHRGRPMVAFSCGSYGGYLADGSEFRGDYADSMTLQQLADFHRARLAPVRHRPEIDLLAFETVPCLKEAQAIVELLRKEEYGKPAWISFSCRDGERTCHGESFARECVPLLAAAAAEGLVAATGINCTAPRHVASLLTAARRQLQEQGTRALAATGEGAGGAIGAATASAAGSKTEQLAQQPQLQQPLLLLCYPNSGEDWDGEHRCWRHVPDDIAEPSAFAAAAAGWVASAGVRLLGGCCRTGPDHIAALRRVLFAEGGGEQGAPARGLAPVVKSTTEGGS